MKHCPPVPLPERIVTSTNKSGTYVYLTREVKYSKELKCSRPVRTSIGKLNEDGLLIPNQNYFEIFGEHMKMVAPSERSDFLSIGPHMVMDKIARKMELDAMLDSIFGEFSCRILDVATYLVMMENNAMHYFEDYGFSHSLFSEKNFTDSTIGRLPDQIQVKDIDLFMNAWIRSHVDKKIYVAYDSTNMNCVAGNLELAEFGHSKEDPTLPQINVSLGYDASNQIPLFYEIYPGSIIDNTECEKMVERALRYGCKDIGFILDRGYFSIKNIKYFEEHGYDYLLMTKGNARFVQEVIKEYGAMLKNGYSYYIQDHELYGMTVEKDVFQTGKAQYVHVYYDGMRVENEKIQINNTYGRMNKELEDRVNRKLQRKEDVKKYETYYRLKLDDNGYFISYQRKDSVIRKMMEETGYFVIISSEEMSASEALERYRDRDAVEKVFRMEKSYLGFDVFRVHSERKMESKMFLSFIALILRNEIYRCLKELYKKNRKEYTVPKVLATYNRLGITRLSDEKYHLRYNLTSKQKKVLEAVGLTEKEYKKFANRIMAQMG